ncbi:hypothetical protein LCGC14_1065250 [marine sediment metagenome]|uniref:SpaA-like prealbumin fold domain-containing protein n=1 Tax=marine sediment metagenome TaxID=412755 RepID=A0A0F9QQP7_9ZZZZ
MSWLFTEYTLNVSLLSQQERATQMKLIVRDLDDRPVPNAEVALMNYSAPNQNSTVSTVKTNTRGVAKFENIKFGSYNITVKYSINNGSYIYNEILYNSSNIVNGSLNLNVLNYLKFDKLTLN